MRGHRSADPVAPAAAMAAACCALASELVAAQVQFVDATASSGLGGFTHSPNSLSVPGLNEWIMGGIGVGDFNGDGWPDIYVPRGGAGADRLYMNNGGGNFTNRAPEWGISLAHAGNGVACADFDGDGRTDIYVTSYGTALDNLGQVGRHRLYRNTGTGFVDVATAVGVHRSATTGSVANGAAWGDYDLDGDLDLAVAGWSSVHFGNRVFRNDGGVFTEVTPPVLLSAVTWGFQPAFVDLTGDGFPELLFAADFETGRAFVNQRDGSFQLATEELGLGIDDNGMGHCVADFDRDGLPDYFVTSIHMDVPNAGMYNGNTLYMQGADAVPFREEALARGCSDGGWGWGVVAVDLDHDGWEDMVEANGRNAGQWANEQEYVYRNTGGGVFERLGATTGLNLAADSRAVALIDHDRDGDMDVLVLVNAGPLKLYRNDSVKSGGWLQLDLSRGDGSRVAPHGIGSLVEVRQTQGAKGGEGAKGEREIVLRRFVHFGSSYNASSEHLVHVGLPDAVAPADVRIEWPSGQTTVIGAVAPNQRLAVTAPARSDLDADGAVGKGDLAALMGAWGGTDLADRAVRAADLDRDGVVGARDLAILLSEWSR
jgi:enediyne biosynthesis protein E4